MNLLPFDTETTSLDVTDARVWQFGTDSVELYFNPGVEISDIIREKCHITPEMLDCIRTAPPFDPSCVDILRRADALLTQNGILYDVPVLENRWHLNGPANLPPVFDVRALAFEKWPNLKNHKAVNVALSLGLIAPEDVEKAHGVKFDSYLARLIWQNLPPKWTADLQVALGFQQRARLLQESDWERFGHTGEKGEVFMWFRTCRRCMGEGCSECNGVGALHHTQKRRGEAIRRGSLRWMVGRGIPNLSAEVLDVIRRSS